MIKVNRKILLTVTVISSFCLGFFVCKKTLNPQVITNTEVKEVIVEKVVYVEIEKKDENKQIITTIIEKPDGIKETVIIENTTTSTTTQQMSQTDTATQSEIKTVQSIPKKNNKATLLTHSTLDIRPSVNYGVYIERRLIGSVWLGAGYSSINGENLVNLGISLEF